MNNEFMGFEEYRDDWRLKRPASIPVEIVEESPYPIWARFAALAAFICSALVSGVHMMPAVYDAIPLSPIVTELMRQWVARGSFVAYELGMFMSAFLMAVQSSKRLAQIVSAIIFLTLIAVNLYSVVKVYGFNLQENFAGAAVSTMFSLVPAIAYASGKFYINIGVAERAAERRGKETLRDDERKLDESILKDYKRDKKEWEKSQAVQLSNGHVQWTNTHPSASNLGHTKRPDAAQIVQRHLVENPQDAEREARDLAAYLGVGKSTVNNVQRQMRSNGHSSNGHSTLQ